MPPRKRPERDAPVNSPSPRRSAAVLCLALAALVAGIYLQTAGFGFVFDDFLYIADNRLVNAGLTWEAVRSAFSGVRWASGTR